MKKPVWISYWKELWIDSTRVSWTCSPCFAWQKICCMWFFRFFCMLSRDILYEKLFRYGVRGVAWNLIKSYFDNRRQYVSFGSVDSETLISNWGVIQGNKNGPLFFDIYSNDINYLCNENECIIFADDTCLTNVFHDLNFLFYYVNKRLSRIFDWCNFNKLCINPEKSEFMVISNWYLQKWTKNFQKSLHILQKCKNIWPDHKNFKRMNNSKS